MARTVGSLAMVMVVATLLVPSGLASPLRSDDTHLLASQRRRSDDPDLLAEVVEKQAAELQETQAKMAAMQAALQGAQASLEAKVAANLNHIHDLQASQSQQVAFTATIQEANSPLSKNSPIPFHRVLTNIGSAYDPNTSIFTAPFQGTYMFFVSVDVSVDYRGLSVFKNGSPVLYGHNDGDDHHIVAGGALTLAQGDKVWVVHGFGAGIVDGGEEAVFTGFKI